MRLLRLTGRSLDSSVFVVKSGLAWVAWATPVPSGDPPDGNGECTARNRRHFLAFWRPSRFRSTVAKRGTLNTYETHESFRDQHRIAPNGLGQRQGFLSLSASPGF